MDKEKKKIKEPYEPEKTPNPPQRMDPEAEKKPDRSGADERKPSKGTSGKEDQREEPHLLSDETEIDDETTI